MFDLTAILSESACLSERKTEHLQVSESVGAGEGNRTLVFSLEGWRLSLCRKHLAVKLLVSASNRINGLAARCKTYHRTNLSRDDRMRTGRFGTAASARWDALHPRPISQTAAEPRGSHWKRLRLVEVSQDLNTLVLL
jgi:hypothetical protein